MKYFTRLERFALPILRVGLALVFFWFGANQILNPEQWIGFLPAWTSGLFVSQTEFVLINGWFEIVSAVLLVFGAYTNIVALLLSLHLFGIAFSIGASATGVRDFGLAVATLALSLLGGGSFSADIVAWKKVG